MKNTLKFLSICVFILFVGLINGFAQKHNKENRHKGKRFNHGNRGFNVRSQYRPNRARHFRPSWAHDRYYNRRWVYFPRYNFYWDNWRQMYVYQNNNYWSVNTNPPPTIININIENEKHYELNPEDDDQDTIYKSNRQHIQNDAKK